MALAESLLFLVPVAVAAAVAFLLTRRPSSAPVPLPPSATTGPSFEPPAEPPDRVWQVRSGPPDRRWRKRNGDRRKTAVVVPHPTLFHAAYHAALESHLSVMRRKKKLDPAKAATLAAYSTARMVSSRRPTRIPRRPSHRCPRKPE